MRSLLWRLGGALTLGVLGLYMTFYALERTALTSLAAGPGVADRPAAGTYLLLFGGLAILNLSTFYALTRWSRFVRANPHGRQAPVWLLILIMMFAGVMLLVGVAVHSGWVRSQDEVPTDISQGFVLYEVTFSALLLMCLVLIAVRWSPGYKHRPVDR
jgi:hypothetical protein